MVDSIDTMLLMGLYEFSNRSLIHVAQLSFHEVRVQLTPRAEPN